MTVDNEMSLELDEDEELSPDEQTLVSSVDLDEMAFASSLFFAAARGQVPLAVERSTDLELRRELRFRDPVLANIRNSLVGLEEAASDEISLACAVAVIWHHYEGTANRQAICSRLVAFYSLMVRTQGAVLGARDQSFVVNSTSELLRPSVIKAVATAPLSVDGQFDDELFATLISGSRDPEKFIETRSQFPPRTREEPSIAVTDIVHELAQLLFACDATRAVSGSPKHYKLRAFEKLCEPFATATGAPSLKPLLSRALASASSSYPWLGSAHVTESGQIEDIDEAQLELHPGEVYQAELALMGSLVELLRSLLGDEVTIQLLRTVWPLAFLRPGSRSDTTS